MDKRISVDFKKVAISLAVIAVVAIMAVVSRNWQKEKIIRSQPVDNEEQSDLTAAQTQVVANYQTELGRVLAGLAPLLDKKLEAKDAVELANWRDQLINLAVPLEQQTKHLQLVLKLSLLVDLLSPGYLRLASQGLPSVSELELQLKQLVK
ncbi:MAG: hypothetical protein HY973_01265 [Candidatus Kerfeldbacteria bacterium]|nr:hypothetical protein [Candidatus Kerfeldbacteria bacterium]